MKNFLLIACLFLYCASAVAQQDHALLKKTVDSFVKQQTADLPGKIAYHVDEIDSRIALRACDRIEAFLPAGSKLIGRVSIGVRCMEANGWSLFIPVQIKITRDLLISAHPLTAGQIVREQDIARLTTETTQPGGITDSKLVIGKVLRYSIASSSILRESMLRAPYSIKQGQSVRLSVQGSGFSISSAGVALNNASEGESVQIRTSTGRVISGMAVADGVAQITP
ncbi:MAG: flagellar basal body P-ring formation chaperone FlgA [Gallionella sp.]|nr:flagellar basal body P-ring formation chaperone FlgA [Gallionella sp.]MDP1939296.1 flagellar basal body P-ring formation chaperone FlgA [Gallionella sp.]